MNHFIKQPGEKMKPIEEILTNELRAYFDLCTGWRRDEEIQKLVLERAFFKMPDLDETIETPLKHKKIYPYVTYAVSCLEIDLIIPVGKQMIDSIVKEIPHGSIILVRMPILVEVNQDFYHNYRTFNIITRTVNVPREEVGGKVYSGEN